MLAHMEIDTNSVATMAAELFDSLQLSWNSLRMTMTTGERSHETRTRAPTVEREAGFDSLKERNSVQDGQQGPQALSHKEKDGNSVATMAADLIDSLQLSWNSLKMTAASGERGAETKRQASSDSVKARKVQDEVESQRPSSESVQVEPMVSFDKGEDTACLGDRESASSVRVVASSETAGLTGEEGEKESKSGVRAVARSETVGLPLMSETSLEMSCNSLRTTAKTSERGTETPVAVRSSIVERQASSDNVTEFNIQDGNVRVGPPPEYWQVGSTASDSGGDSASPVAKGLTSKYALDLNGSETNSETIGFTKPQNSITCDACGRGTVTGPLFRSGKKASYHLCPPCFESSGAKRQEFTMIDSATLRRIMAFNAGHLESDKTAGGQIVEALAREGGLPTDQCLLAMLERPGFKTLSADLLERNNVDSRKPSENLFADTERDPVPGKLQEFPVTDWSSEDGPIPLGMTESLQMLKLDPLASVHCKTDCGRDSSSSPGEKDPTWNVLNASDCNPSNCQTGAEIVCPAITSRCDGCGKATPFRSGRIFEDFLCFQCAEKSQDEENSATIYPFYFAHPTLVGLMVDGSTPGYRLSGAQTTKAILARAYESGFPLEKKVVAKSGELGFSSQQLNAELPVHDSFESDKTMDDLCAEEEWDQIPAELEELGFYDSKMNRT